MRRSLAFVGALFAIVVTFQLAWAALVTWNPGFEGTPAGGDPISQGDDRVRELKENIRERLETEIEYGTQIGPDTGRMREGSARAYFQAAAPTAIPQPDINGASVLGASDEGRLWRDSDAGAETLSIWNGSAFVDVVRRWTLGVRFDSTVDLSPGGTVLQKAGANGMDPHEHSSRHRDLTSAVGGAEDYLSFSIQQILQDTTLNAAAPANGAFSCATATTLAGVGFDTTGRRAASTSRALVVAQAAANDITGAESVTIGLCDGAANLGGATSHQRIISGQPFTDGSEHVTIVFYWTSISISNHTAVALAASDTNGDSNFTVGQIMIVDLGVDTP